MKAVLKFDLNDPSDRIDYNQCNKANDMAAVLWELSLNSRKNFTKHREGEDESFYKAAYEIFDHIYSLLREHDIDVEKLYS